MAYKIVERNIGRAGNKFQIEQKQKEWDHRFGKGKWLTGYEVNGQFMTREEAIEKVYDAAYFDYLDRNRSIVEVLKEYSGVFNPHALFTNSTDIQAQTIERYFNSRRISFTGKIKEKAPIGTWQPKDMLRYESKIRIAGLRIENGRIVYPSIAKYLSPFSIKTLHDNNMSVEGFWQSSAKCLAVIE